MKKRVEEFPIEEKIVREFIKENKEKWEKSSVGIDGQKYIYINCSMVRMQVAWVVPKLLFAKGLEAKTGAKPVVITWRENPLLTSFFASFKIAHISLDVLNQRNLGGLWKAFWKTMNFLMLDGSGEGLKQLDVSGVNIGMALYEDILRTSSLSTLRDCRNKTCLKKLVHLIWSYYSLEKECRKCPIQYAVTDDMAYHEGAFIKLFKSLGARVFASSNVAEQEIVLDEQGKIKRYPQLALEKLKKSPFSITKDGIKWTENYLEERFQGKNGRDIDRGAFLGKRVFSKEEIIGELGLRNKKKNIVIMAHTFTDAVFNYGTYYFRDYYDWLDQTLRIAESVTDVNWILKPHPTRGAYNESKDSVEKMFARHKRENIFLLADEISAESIKNIADCIITIGGNAGAEFSCFGIPAIVIGKPYYHGWGYTIEPRSYEEYEMVLKSISNLKRLSQEQVSVAKTIFYMQNEKRKSDGGDYSDEFAMLVNGLYQKMRDCMAVEYFASNEGTERYNSETLISIMNYGKENRWEKTEYYQRGFGK